MSLRLAIILTVFLWLGTFICVVPARLLPPKGITLPGFLIIIYSFPSSRESDPAIYMVSEYSYWIGLMMLLITSVLVIVATGKSKRVMKIVVLVDLGVVILSILTSIFWFAV